MPTDTPLPATKSRQLTDKQRRFIEEYPKDCNATQAAIRAGYKPENAGDQAAKLSVKLRPYLDAQLQAVKDQNALSPKRVLEELRRLAFMDYGQLYDPDTGQPIPIHKLPIEARAAISGVESVQYNSDPGDGKRDNATKTRIRTWSKDKALELLAKHFGLVDDKVEHSGTLVIRHELAPSSPQDSPKPLELPTTHPVALHPPEGLESGPVRVSGSRVREAQVIDCQPVDTPDPSVPNG